MVLTISRQLEEMNFSSKDQFGSNENILSDTYWTVQDSNLV